MRRRWWCGEPNLTLYRIFSSSLCNMFCIAIVLLLQCLFGSDGYTYNNKVGGQEYVQLDLFDSLHLHNSTHQGLKLGKGVHTLSPGIIFSGDFRDILISGDGLERIRHHFSKVDANEFTISAIVKQNPNNVGTLLAFSRGLISALEIQSSGRKDELRVISESMVETFPFRLADGSWHRVALSFSASQVTLFVDCSLLHRRVLPFNPLQPIHHTYQNISLWIGQKPPSHFLYQGAMQDLRLTFGPYGYLSQCPQLDTQCPTCSEFNALKMSFSSLQSQIQILTARLSEAEARLTNVEECECQKSCKINATLSKEDGSSWRQDCQVCTCKKGEILCQALQCPRVPCKNPITVAGECCPTCLKQCYFQGRKYDSGEVESGGSRNIPMSECKECICKNGSMQCKKRDPEEICPVLTCPPEDQIIVPDKCCKVCPGTDYCALHKNTCHSNATCVNLQTTFLCQCNEGFSGDGVKSCQDLDECLLERYHCARNSVCVNRPGGYDCECNKGFRNINQFQCEDIDECSEGSHKCHKHATCLNSKGSYSCSCKEGYSGDGFQCSPICNRTCENGGLCIAPDVCSCRPGWMGDQCQTDVDECLQKTTNNTTTNDTANPKLCPPNAICVNKPGWHFCQCREGYQALLNSIGEAHCQDVNECEEKNICADGLQCVNTEGSYQCQCPPNNQECSQGCMEEQEVHALGSQWVSEDCHICTCVSPGTTSCQADTSEFCSRLCTSSHHHHKQHNNNNNDNNDNVHKCCDNCAYNNASNTLPLKSQPKSCPHQLYSDIQYQSGEVWYSNCQTCECLDGETDCWPMDCPPVNCANAFLPPGDCCYRCPGGSSNNDQCTHWHRNSTFSQCHLLEDTIQSGTRVTLPHSHCISCKCQEGELCCSYDYDCVAHESDAGLLTSSSPPPLERSTVVGVTGGVDHSSRSRGL